MTTIAVIGAGITGVTTAYALVKSGFNVIVLDRHRYPAMDTSFANGGQLSACNAEVWNNTSTVIKGLKWMFKKNAPLLLNPAPSLHKYTWLAEFLKHIRDYEHNTIETTKLAIAAREPFFKWAEEENIDFDLEKRGILHVYQSKKGFESGLKVSQLLARGGLERRAVTPEEINDIEPTLVGKFYGGFYTPSDSTGDIHKYTCGLAKACERHGVKFLMDVEVQSINPQNDGHQIRYQSLLNDAPLSAEALDVDAVVICAGVGSRKLAAMMGDRVNIYPVKGYSITVNLQDEISQNAAPWVSLLDEEAKIVTSRLGQTRFRVAGTAEYNGENRNIRADRIKPLVDWTRRNFQQTATEHVVPWAGLRPMMPDMMPRVQAGKRPGIFYNTGHGHLGWTLSAATAQAVAYTIRTTLPTTATLRPALG